jgi:magnesium transporter
LAVGVAPHRAITMLESAPMERAPDRLSRLYDALESGTLVQARRTLNDLHPAEIADLLESLPLEQREIVWEMVDTDQKGDVLLHVHDEARARLIEQMETHQLVAAAERLDTDDLADILKDLPGAVMQELLQAMDEQNRKRLRAVLNYPEDSAGGLMNVDTVTVRANVTLDTVLRYLRRLGKIPEMTDSLVVVNRDSRYQGLLPLTDLVTSDPDLTVAEIMGREVEGIPAMMSAGEVARLFEDRDLVSAPVVDEQGRLLGRITIDDVVDVIREEADHSVLSMAGLDEEADMFAPVRISARKRAVWLGINLFTAFIASWVIGLFENTIQHVVALAVLMPIVASMGGIAGTQTLTLVVRGMALGQVRDANARWLLTKELAVGALNGLLWALVVAIIAVAWFRDLRLGTIIGAALVINLANAALTGTLLPLLLRKLNIDPAIAGGVILTTATDVVGFFSFLGLATVFLL